MHNNCLIKLRCYLALVLLISTPGWAPAADIEPPVAFTHALDIYKQQGVRPFINAMVENSPLRGRQELDLQISILEKIEDYYGNYQSVDIVHINTLSNRTRIVYFIMNYEKGPVFGSLTAYRAKSQETITAFDFHTKVDKAFPSRLLTEN